MGQSKKPPLHPLIKQQALDKLLSTCPFCQRQQARFTTSVISANPAAELVHARCQACQAAMVAVLFTAGPMISSIGLLTDLTLEDVSRFQYDQPIVADDLIDVYQALQQTTIVGQLLNV